MVWRSIASGSVALILTPWAIWSALNFITLAAMIAAFKGETLEEQTLLVQQIGYTIGSAGIFFRTYFGGAWAWTKHDRVVLTVAGLAILLWFFTGNPVLAIGLNLAAIGIGAIPLWITLRLYPKAQGEYPWVLWWLSGIFGILVIVSESDWTRWMHPVTLFCFQSFTVYLIFRKEIWSKLL